MSHGGDLYGLQVHMDYSVNLNPRGTPACVIDALTEGIRGSRSYPDILQRDVRCAIAKAENVDPDTVWAGAGASELLSAVTRMVCPRHALLISPCFSGYAHAIKQVPECRVTDLALSEDTGFALTDDLVREKLLPALETDADILYLANPQNPSGTMIGDALLVTIFEHAATCGVTVVLDESFYMLSDRAFDRDPQVFQTWTSRFSNLYLIRSYTKSFALPGIRMGYVIGAAENIVRMVDYLPEWNLSVPAGKAMEAAAKVQEDGTFFQKAQTLIRKERAFLQEALTGLGFTVYGSETVYLLFRGREGLFEALLARGILIRDCSDFGCVAPGTYRIAVMTHEKNAELIRAIGEVLHEI